jgi:hypothetical protein
LSEKHEYRLNYFFLKGNKLMAAARGQSMGAWPKKSSALEGGGLTIIIKLYIEKAENIGPGFAKGYAVAGPSLLATPWQALRFWLRRGKPFAFSYAPRGLRFATQGQAEDG